MIKNIVFDIGNVLKDWIPSLDAYFGPEKAKRTAAAIWGSGLWNQMDMGIIDEEEILSQMISRDPECREQILYFWNHLEIVCGRFDYAGPWIQALKDAGFKVYFLSNYSRRLREQVPETLYFLPLMDGGIFSCDVKMMKPDLRIYAELCKKYALVPEECLFIDDKQENIDGAIAYGMKAIRFDGYNASYPVIMKYLSEERSANAVK